MDIDKNIKEVMKGLVNLSKNDLRVIKADVLTESMDIDSHIAPIVRELNIKGYRTLASRSGFDDIHGYIVIKKDDNFPELKKILNDNNILWDEIEYFEGINTITILTRGDEYEKRAVWDKFLKVLREN